jgi:hypothetical protein
LYLGKLSRDAFNGEEVGLQLVSNPGLSDGLSDSFPTTGLTEQMSAVTPEKVLPAESSSRISLDVLLSARTSAKMLLSG